MIKAVPRNLLEGTEELQLMLRLEKSPFIIEFEEWFFHDFIYCIVSEYCEVKVQN